ncbi:MAG TPA: hypothetical protein VIC25_05955 [Caulobacteraceae bacterium]
MKLVLIASLAATCLAGGAAAQTYSAPYDSSGQYDNAQAQRDYQSALNAYDAARDTAARDHDRYDSQRNDYDWRMRDYRRDLRRYNEARDAYDEEYGPGAYEAYNAPPLPPY